MAGRHREVGRTLARRVIVKETGIYKGAAGVSSL